MIKKLDRYIIGKYLSAFIFTMVLVSMVSIAINYFENIDKFIVAKIGFGQALTEYYLHFLPWINGLLSPVFALIAVIFFTSRMARNSEIITILASGVSYDRFLRPYLLSGILIAAVLWVANNYVIPNSTRIKNEFETEKIKRNLKDNLTNDIHFFISPNEKAYFRYYNDRDSSAKNFRLEKIKDGKLIKLLKAEELNFIGRPNKWQMLNIEERYFDGLDEKFVISRNVKIDTVFPFKPEDFTRYTKQMEMMSTTDLRAFIYEEKQRGIGTAKTYLIELYRRTSDPFTIIILTMIGVTVASRKVRGGLGLHLALGVIIGAVFVIISKFSVTFASNLSLSPLLGVWIPNIVFSLVAYFLYKKAQK